MSNTQKALFPYCYFRGQIVPENEARVSISSHSLQYGSTCFGGLRGYHRDGEVRLFRLRDHHQRLMEGSKILGFDFSLGYAEFQEALNKLIEKNAPSTDFYVRPFIFTENQSVAPRFDILSFDLAIYMIPMGQYFDPDKGLNLMVSSWRKFSDASISTKAKAGGCYLNSSLAATEARRCGYDDALLLDQAGYLAEASVANTLLVYRGEVILPQTGAPILDGITMQTVVNCLRSEGIPVRFEQIDRSMLYAADELLLTGTAAQVLYVASVDGRPIGEAHKGPGPVCRRVREHFVDLIEKRHVRSPEWITTVSLADKTVESTKLS